VVNRPIRPAWGVLALSPDGTLLAYDDEPRTGPTGGRVRVIQVTDGATLATLDMPEQALLALRFSPDGRFLAGSDFASNVQVWDTSRWQALYAEPLQADAFNLAFDPAGRLLAGLGRDGATIWHVASGQTVQVLRGAPTRPSDGGFTPQVVWSADGRRLAISNWDGTASIWDAADRAAPAGRAQGRKTAEQRAFAWHAGLAEYALDRADRPTFDFHWRYLRNAAPFDSQTRRQRGRLHARLGELKEALADYDQAFVENPPGPPLPWIATVCLYALNGQRSRALKIVRESRQTFVPGFLAGEVNELGMLWSVLEDPEADAAKTLAMMHAVLPKAPKHAGVHCTLALASCRAGQFDAALRQAQESYDKGTDWKHRPLAWLVQALAYQAQGKAAEARRQLQRAEEWQTQNGNEVLRLEVYDGLAFLLLMQEAQAKIKSPAEQR
jgi:tetratricopeptide (TPR) repeat protein